MPHQKARAVAIFNLTKLKSSLVSLDDVENSKKLWFFSKFEWPLKSNDDEFDDFKIVKYLSSNLLIHENTINDVTAYVPTLRCLDVPNRT